METFEGEGSGSLPPTTDMDEHIVDLAKQVKRNISYKNLDHLLEMDVDELKRLSEEPRHTKRRSMNKSGKEIMSHFNNLDTTLEKAQLLSIVLTHKDLIDPMKLLGIDTTNQKRKSSQLQKYIVDNVKKGLVNIGKKSRKLDKTISRRVMLTSLVNERLPQKRQISSLSSEFGFSRRTISKYVKRRKILDDTTSEGNWAIMCRAPHSDRIEDVVRNFVTSFWNDNTHPSSNMLSSKGLALIIMISM